MHIRGSNGKENRVLIVSKSPMAPMIFDRPSLEDRQLCANVLGVELTSLGISVLGVRIPAYEPEIARLRIPAWGWLEKTATSLNGRPSVIIGDLNAKESYGRLKRILAKRVASRRTWRTDLLGYQGRTSEIDHILATNHCTISEACVRDRKYSDHAPLSCRIEGARTVTEPK